MVGVYAGDLTNRQSVAHLPVTCWLRPVSQPWLVPSPLHHLHTDKPQRGRERETERGSNGLKACFKTSEHLLQLCPFLQHLRYIHQLKFCKMSLQWLLRTQAITGLVFPFSECRYNKCNFTVTFPPTCLRAKPSQTVPWPRSSAL